MNPENAEKTIWDIAEGISICMLTSSDGGTIRSRPMAAHVDRQRHEIAFLTDAGSHKEEEIAADPRVAVIFCDPRGHRYASINGTARLLDDRTRVHALWSTAFQAFWDSPDDPAIRVLSVTPEEGQFWDAPGTMVSMIKMLASSFSDRRPDLGRNETTRM